MRAVAASIVMLAGCYSPTLRDCEIQCASGSCPSGFDCRDSVCRAHGEMRSCAEVLADASTSDTSSDGSARMDADGDGVDDSIDNCPGLANPFQDNEDGDEFGDACDPCPIGPSIFDNTDADGDGVGGGCDPDLNSGQPDHILVFEGFNRAPVSPAVIEQPTNATWSFNGQAVSSVASAAEYVSIGWPSPPATSSRVVWAKVTYVSEAGTGTGAGPMDVEVPGTNGGFACMLFSDPVNLHEAAIVELPATARSTQALTFSASSPPFVLKLGHAGGGGAFNCIVNSGSSFTYLTPNALPPTSLSGIRVKGMVARFDWVMIMD